jgi:hemerythrin superfamily protein
MPTASTSTGKSNAKRARSRSAVGRKTAAARGQDATALLMADHRAVEKLFGQFEKAREETRKDELAQRICMELRLHMQIEEEIFYPTSREFLDDEEIVNEAVVEHQAAKDLMEQLDGMTAEDGMFDAKVSVLKEMIEHHVQEEEKEFFPQVRKTDMDLKATGEQMKARKQTLTSQMDAGSLTTQ